MPIVKVTSDLVKDYNNPASREADPAKVRGRPIVAAGRVANAASDLSGSKYHLIDLPSAAILDSATAFQVQNTGFAAIRIGTETDVAALVSVLKADGNVVSPVTKFGTAHGKPLWELFGLPSDPGGTIGIYQHAIANATAAGSMLFEIHYRFR